MEKVPRCWSAWLFACGSLCLEPQANREHTTVLGATISEPTAAVISEDTAVPGAVLSEPTAATISEHTTLRDAALSYPAVFFHLFRNAAHASNTYRSS